MKRVIVLATAAAVMSTAAFAASDTATVKKIDAKSDAVTLSDGKTFTWGEGTEAETLKIGEKVIVTYATKAGKMVASKVVVTK